MSANSFASQADAGPRDGADAALWTALASASDAASFCRAWLDLQCRRTAGALTGLVLLRSPEGTYAPAALWPEAPVGLDHLRAIAERALTQGQAVVESDPDTPGRTGIAYPIAVQGESHGAVVLLVTGGGAATLQQLVRELHWGVGWIMALIWQHRAEEQGVHALATSSALDVLAAVEEHPSLHEAAMALCNALAVALHADQVSFGLIRDDRARLVATSHGAWFRKRSDMAEAIEAAMDEAIDHGRTTAFPAPPGDGAIILQQARLAASAHRDAAASILAQDRGLAVGVITIERSGPGADIAGRDLILAEAVAGLVAPLLALRAREERWVSGRIRTKSIDGLKALFGPRRPLAKAIGAAALIALVILLLPVSHFRVGADATLEGSVQRAAAAPFSGYIARSYARAGDIVREGQVLATLDDRDLRLDRAKSAGEVEQYDRRYREALAKHERADMNLFGAQLRQAQAQLSLIDYRIARTSITAPLSGVLVSGDVSQLVGTPVKEGEVLFQVAPLEGFRVALQVDETDLPYLFVGQRGRFAPTGLAGDTVNFTLSKITSVTESEDGKNRFRVEAQLDGDAPPTLRPGMEGVGKITIDRRSKLWVWTRGLRNWLRLFLWKWLP